MAEVVVKMRIVRVYSSKSCFARNSADSANGLGELTEQTGYLSYSIPTFLKRDQRVVVALEAADATQREAKLVLKAASPSRAWLSKIPALTFY